jgi:peptidoglycan/LPS O-acetylase OafA/YrhL
MTDGSVGAQPRLDGLDALRGVAVIVVVVFHGGVLPYGWIGVDLFFCISGLLITRILIEPRAQQHALRSVLIPFYIRRALRILPLAWLAAAVVAALTGAGWSTLWYAAFLVNWLPNPPAPRELGHYWTLAVEEQFYWLWPFAAVLLSPRNLLKLIAAALVLCFVARGVLLVLPGSIATAHILGNATVARADPILVGAALAVALQRGWLSRDARLWQRGALLGLVIGVAGFAGFETLAGYPWHAWAPRVAYVFATPSLALAMGSLLLLVILAPPAWARWSWLEGIGRISFGIYVIHGCMSPLLRATVADSLARTAILMVASIILAAISWRLLEQPLLAWKSRWPMPR